MIDNAQINAEDLKEKILEAFSSNDSQPATEEQNALTPESEARGVELVSKILDENSQALESVAYELLGSLVISGVGAADKVAELMMESNPTVYSNSIFKAADRCTDIFVKFALVRAVFRRYPGRYRPYMLTLGRELLHTSSQDSRVFAAAGWMLWKFGGELLPELVALVKGSGSEEERLRLLQDSVRCLGGGALPIVSAAADSDNETLKHSAAEALKRLGQNA